MHHHVWLFCMGSGDWTQVFMLSQLPTKPFTERAISFTSLSLVVGLTLHRQRTNRPTSLYSRLCSKHPIWHQELSHSSPCIHSFSWFLNGLRNPSTCFPKTFLDIPFPVRVKLNILTTAYRDTVLPNSHVLCTASGMEGTSCEKQSLNVVPHIL